MSRGLLVFMATVTHFALVVLTAGLIFYVTDDDVIVERDAGTLLGPAMVLGSMATVFFALARRFGVEDRDVREGSGADGVRHRRILPLALLTALASYVLMLVIGSLIYSFERNEAVWLVLFAGRYSHSPFVVVTSIWAGVVVTVFLVLARVETARQQRDGRHDDL
ncbi:hypothetical protein AX769_05975 [Frondihabitans sp. PAMC 28766]|uniref:DUF6121 family protein n=1 Tax=Frondihabitans sp. PAMC 28766 TaxID=1795630 RepID=UPI00078D21F4|nr:DUF6121 family protein [Frondihabitans sp. PAMC 28766]AMM19780.1 hypothetical protein AX769_05975 [Frondihabitans sp. PAMC 28766]